MTRGRPTRPHEIGLAHFEALDRLDGEVADTRRPAGRGLVARIRTGAPTAVLGHDPTAVFSASSYVNHRDHREVGFALLDASPAAASPRLLPPRPASRAGCHT